MTIMTIEELRRLEAEATAGPWWSDGEYQKEEAGLSVIAAREDSGPLPGNPTRGQVAFVTELLPENASRAEADAALIVAMRNALPELLRKAEAFDRLVAQGGEPHGASMSVEAPERIWVYEPERVNKPRKIVSELLPVANCPEDFEGRTEYVRADKLEELAAENGLMRFDERAYKSTIEHLTIRADKAEAALSEAKRENEALREALEPFALEYEKRARLAPGPDIDHWPIGGSALTYKHIRIAYEQARNAGGKDA